MYRIDWMVHFSALLSAVGENNVPLAIRVNIEGKNGIYGIDIFLNFYGICLNLNMHFCKLCRSTQCNGTRQAIQIATICTFNYRCIRP